MIILLIILGAAALFVVATLVGRMIGYGMGGIAWGPSDAEYLHRRNNCE